MLESMRSFDQMMPLFLLETCPHIHFCLLFLLVLEERTLERNLLHCNANRGGMSFDLCKSHAWFLTCHF